MENEIQKYIDYIIRKINSINDKFINQDIRERVISEIFKKVSNNNITSIDQMKKMIDEYTINMLADFLDNKLYSKNIINNIDFNQYDENSKFFSNALLIANKVATNLNGESFEYENLNLPRLYGIDFSFENNGRVNFKFENGCNYIEYVKKFYYQLFPNDIEIINNIFNNVRCIEGSGRPYFNGVNINMYLDKNRGLDLGNLYSLVHEMAHNLYFKFHNNSSRKDEELEEIESEYMEQLFSLYLLDNPIKCIDNEKVRNISLQDIERRQFNVMKNSFVNNSFRIINEVNFLKLFNKNGKKIDRQLLYNYSNSPDINSLIESGFVINDIISHYANPKEDLRCHNGEHLSNECRFLYSGILSLNFSNILGNIQNVDKFVKYMKTDKEYGVNEFLRIFNLTEKDYLCLATNYTNNYLHLKNKYNHELKINNTNYISNYRGDFLNTKKQYLENIKYELIKIKQNISNSNSLGYGEQEKINGFQKRLNNKGYVRLFSLMLILSLVYGILLMIS